MKLQENMFSVIFGFSKYIDRGYFMGGRLKNAYELVKLGALKF